MDYTLKTSLIKSLAILLLASCAPLTPESQPDTLQAKSNSVVMGNYSPSIDVGSSNQNWPDKTAIALVTTRRDSAPRDGVGDVDWYSPLETVVGGKAAPLNLVQTTSAKLSSALQSAVALAQDHDSYALLVWQSGELRLEKYWSGFDLSSRYQTASMHKTVVATLLGICVDEGLIDSLDDPLKRYLPELAEHSHGNASLRSILEMASGIGSEPFSNDSAALFWQSLYGDDLGQSITRFPSFGEPFEAFYYTAANSQYLSWVIERVSGMRYAQYLSEKLWQPMGAQDAKVWLDRIEGSSRGFCCLQATAQDWLRFGLLILNEGRVDKQQLVSKSWIRNMQSPSSINPNYGWQLWRGTPHNPKRAYNPTAFITVPAAEPFLADDVYFLDGNGGQRVYVTPSAELVIVRIGTSTREWDDSELPNLILSALK